MSINRNQIRQSTYNNNSVGRVFRRGSFWDRMFKAATGIATVFIAPLGAAMALADKVTPERDPLPTGERGGSSGGRGFNYDAGNVSGVGKLNDGKKVGNAPKVF